MSLSKYSKRRGQFEALEAKQLFAADLVGGAAADLPDTVVVAENISEDDFVINPLNVRTNLGGQEGEPLMNTNLSDHLIVNGETLYQRNELDLAPNLGGQEGEPLVDTDSSSLWLSQLHHIKPHGSAGSYSDYPEITDQYMGETAISKRDQAYSLVGFQDMDPHLPHVDYQILGGQEGEDIAHQLEHNKTWRRELVDRIGNHNLVGQEGDAFAAEDVTGDSAAIAVVDSVFSRGAIRLPMTADTSGIGAVDVSGIAVVDTCGLSQGALRLI